jgi:hypothetical protein
MIVRTRRECNPDICLVTRSKTPSRHAKSLVELVACGALPGRYVYTVVANGRNDARIVYYGIPSRLRDDNDHISDRPSDVNRSTDKRAGLSGSKRRSNGRVTHPDRRRIDPHWSRTRDDEARADMRADLASHCMKRSVGCMVRKCPCGMIGETRFARIALDENAARPTIY